MEKDLSRATVDIALKKLDRGESTEKIHLPRLGTGGNFSDVFFWDTAFTALWAKYHRDALPVEESLDNLYRLQDDDGFISRQYLPSGESKWSKEHPISFAPPVLAWAELDLFEITGDVERLRRVYTPLKKHHAFCAANYQQKDGLFIGDPYGCGMDNLPRWPRDWKGSGDGQLLQSEHIHPSTDPAYVQRLINDPKFSWNTQGRYIDMSAQMAFNALCLKKIADALGQPNDSERFAQQHAHIRDAINDLCWSGKHGFYFDIGYDRQIERYHIGAYWTLIAQVVPAEHLDVFLSHLTQPDKFGRTVPVPTLAYDDPDYDCRGGYWRGSSWAPTTYMVLRGLKVVNAENLAVTLARKYYQAVESVFHQTGTLWENMCPESAAPGNPSQKDYCGWAGLGTVAVYREFLDTGKRS